MSAKRLDSGVERPAAVQITVDGNPVKVHPGESLAAALLAAGYRIFRRTAGGEPRGPFCNMGVCFECAVTVDGVPNRRACMTPVSAGQRIERQGCGGEENPDANR